MNYLKEIIFTAIVCGIMAGLADLGKNSSGKFIKFVCSLAFMCVLLSPFFDNSDLSISVNEYLEKFSVSDDSVTDDNTVEIGLISDEICKAAASNAAEKFSVPADNFSIKIIIEDIKDDPRIKEVTVYISGQALHIDTTLLKKHFSSIFECPVEVIKDEEAATD